MFTSRKLSDWVAQAGRLWYPQARRLCYSQAGRLWYPFGIEADVEDIQAILKRNLDEVEARIQAACRRAGRRREDVLLVAVTKYVDVEVARLLYSLGVWNLGESRPQELWKKAPAIPAAAWHFVGHLQRNKVEASLPWAFLIHSVDSLRLLDALEDTAKKQGRIAEVLIEFNLSGESAKHGFHPKDVDSLVERISSLSFVEVEGLMTMAAMDADAEATRRVFVSLRDLRAKIGNQLPTSDSFNHLSMGMTNDFEVAIEEGATMVRIGSALFRGLPGIET